ncbi:hypothetical protein, partial [Ilumatobacter sp.]|uniref:hypothetical protein n=1 Tax=Ilumatobacter sp. TaxID=1967498 RepID=UPI003751152F
RIAFHGHWHHAHDTELTWIDRVTTEQSGALAWQSTRTVGLSCDGDTIGGWLILDVATLDVRWPTPPDTGHIAPSPTRSEPEVEP